MHGKRDILIAIFGFLLLTSAAHAYTVDEVISDLGAVSQIDALDLDDDGLLDVVLIADDELIIFHGLPDGVESFNLGPAHTFSLADVNDDDLVDLLIGFDSTSDLYHLAAPFSYEHQASVDGFHRGKLADADGDGDGDIVAATIFSDAVYYIEQWATGQFAPIQVEAPGQFQLIRSHGVADLDNDGQSEVILSTMDITDGSSYVRVRELTDGAFEIRYHQPGVHGDHFRFADLDRDGYLDALLTSDWGNTYSFISGGSALSFSFTTLVELFPQKLLQKAILDLDNDGWLDIVYLHEWGNLWVDFNLHSGTFQRQHMFDLDIASHSDSRFAACDLGNDGRPDLLTSDVWGNLLRIQPDPVELIMSPNGGPPTIPAEGGEFMYRVRLFNSVAQPVSGHAWMTVTGPGYDNVPVVATPVILQPGTPVYLPSVTQAVPGGVDAGEYTITVHVGAYTNPVASSESFILTKQGDAGGRSGARVWPTPVRQSR